MGDLMEDTVCQECGQESDWLLCGLCRDCFNKEAQADYDNNSDLKKYQGD